MFHIILVKRLISFDITGLQMKGLKTFQKEFLDQPVNTPTTEHRETRHACNFTCSVLCAMHCCL